MASELHLGRFFAGPNSVASSIPSVVSGSSAGASTGSLGLPDLPWSDWELKADDIIITKDAEGNPIKLGSGAYGTVGPPPPPFYPPNPPPPFPSKYWRTLECPGAQGKTHHYPGIGNDDSLMQG